VRGVRRLRHAGALSDLLHGSGGKDRHRQVHQRLQVQGATTFAIVGDLPNGCVQSTTRDDFEPGQGYVEVANATGGEFGSLCGDMTKNLQNVARVATALASEYGLSNLPASASIRIAIGPAGSGRIIHRSRTDGFDYDPVTNRVIFYGDARPKDGEEVAIAYRRWDWAGNTFPPSLPWDPASNPYDPSTPGHGAPTDPDAIDPFNPMSGGDNPNPNTGVPDKTSEACDLCATGTSCDPTLDTVVCIVPCGESVCVADLACNLETATCGDPGTVRRTRTQEDLAMELALETRCAIRP